MIVPEDFKRALARLAGTVTVITTRDEAGQPWGFTATAFCSLSLNPPLVLFCLSKDADCYQAFTRGRAFAVHMLTEQQRDLAQRFATKGRGKYRGIAFSGGRLGPPLLDGALVTLDPESLPTWAQAHGKQGGVEELYDDPDLLAEIQRAVDDANKAVSHAEAIKKFAVLPDAWTEEGGQLTPSLKLKRNVVMREFSDEVEALYRR